MRNLFSIHTIEFIRVMTRNESQELMSMTQGEFKNYKKNGNEYHCYLKHPGIRLILQFRREPPILMRVIINLNAANGGDGNILFNPKFQNLSSVFLATDIAFEEENLNLNLSQFSIGRVDFTVDIQMDSDEEVMAYIALAKRKGLEKNYRNKYKAGLKILNLKIPLMQYQKVRSLRFITNIGNCWTLVIRRKKQVISLVHLEWK